VKSRLEFEKSEPEVGDMVVGIPHRELGEITQVTKRPSAKYGIMFYRLECNIQGRVKSMVVPHFHFNWVGDHWVLTSNPYRIQIEKPLMMDWFVTDPESQTTRAVVAGSAESAVALTREAPTSADTVCVGQLHSVSVKINGAKILRQLLMDIDNRNSPSSPFHGLDCSEGGSAQLRAQMAWMHEARIARFSQAVEDAFEELTCGHGFWWMVEGTTTLHCSQCYQTIPACICPHGSNDSVASE
jgi:hypothetical protein